MGEKIAGSYQGEKQIRMTHERSGSVLLTDAPVDNQGQGRSFSPTDLCGASMASCMLTIMGILAEREGLSLAGAHFAVEKEMAKAPRRIRQISIDMHLPAALNEKEREKLERAADTCPVKASLSAEVVVDVRYSYDVHAESRS